MTLREREDDVWLALCRRVLFHTVAASVQRVAEALGRADARSMSDAGPQ